MSANKLSVISSCFFLVASITSVLGFCFPWTLYSLATGSADNPLSDILSLSISKGLFQTCVGIFCHPTGWVPSGENLDVFVPRITFIIGWVFMCFPTRVKVSEMLQKPVSKKSAIIGGVCEIIGGIFIAVGIAFFTVIHMIASQSLAESDMTGSYQMGYFFGCIGAAFYITSGSIGIRAAKKAASNVVPA